MALVDVEITIASARDLKNVNWKHGDLCSYAVAWIDDAAAPSGQPFKVTTKVDSLGDTNPSWDQKFTLPVPKDNLETARLVVEIYHDKAEDPSKEIVGRASLDLLEAVDAGGYDEVQDYTMKLKRPSGRPHGKLEISVRMRERRGAYGGASIAAPYGQRDWQSTPYPGYGAPPYPAAQPYAQPYNAQPYNPAAGGEYSSYGAPPPQPYGPYTPPPQPYGSYGSYGAPPQANYYNQTPPPSAYGEDPAANKSGGGMSKLGGIGAGLAVGALAGAVGGIALNEFIDHKEDEAAREQEEEDADRYAARDEGYGGDDYGGGYDDDY